MSGRLVWVDRDDYYTRSGEGASPITTVVWFFAGFWALHQPSVPAPLCTPNAISAFSAAVCTGRILHIVPGRSRPGLGTEVHTLKSWPNEQPPETWQLSGP